MKKLDTIFVALLLIGGAIWLWNVNHKPQTNTDKYNACVADAAKELDLEQHSIDSNGQSKTNKQYYYSSTAVAYQNNLSTCVRSYSN